MMCTAVPAQAVREQSAKRAAVVHIEPFGGGDKGAVIARPGKFAGLEKEMDVQTGELARRKAVAAGRGGKPRFPWLADSVMAHVGRITDEQGRPWDDRKGKTAIIYKVNRQAVGKAQDSGVGAQHQRSQRVHIDPNELGARKFFGGGDEESA